MLVSSLHVQGAQVLEDLPLWTDPVQVRVDDALALGLLALAVSIPPILPSCSLSRKLGASIRARPAGFEPATRGLEVRRHIAEDGHSGTSEDTDVIWGDLIAVRLQ